MTDRFIIAVAGAGSNSGKTGFACKLIRHLADRGPVGAVKIATATPDHRCARTGLACECLMFEGRMRLLEDATQVDRPDKDTGAMIAAGAEPVWWMQTTSDVRVESARALVDRLKGPEIWVIEGSGPIRAGRADLSLTVGRPDRDPKPDWFDLLPDVDAIVLSHDGPIDVSARPAGSDGIELNAPILHVDHTSETLPETISAWIDERAQSRGVIRNSTRAPGDATKS